MAEDRKRVYLAGPIFQQSDAACNDWRAKFKACGLFYWMDPMARDFRGREDTAYREIVEGDKADVDACHAVVAAFNACDGITTDRLEEYGEGGLSKALWSKK